MTDVGRVSLFVVSPSLKGLRFSIPPLKRVVTGGLTDALYEPDRVLFHF